MTKILYLPSTWAIDYLTWAEQAQVDVKYAWLSERAASKGMLGNKNRLLWRWQGWTKKKQHWLKYLGDNITILVCHHQHIIHADHPTTLTTLTLFPSADHLDHQDQLDHLIHPDPEQQFAKFAKPFFLEQKLSWTKNCKKKYLERIFAKKLSQVPKKLSQFANFAKRMSRTRLWSGTTSSRTDNLQKKLTEQQFAKRLFGMRLCKNLIRNA